MQTEAKSDSGAAARYIPRIGGIARCTKMASAPKSLSLLEMVVNIVHKAAPNAPIAFNTRPGDTAEAAARWLDAD
jgi:hypothetical protein